MPGDGMWIALGAAVVSVVTLVMTALQNRHGARQKELDVMIARIERMEKQIRQCEEDRDRLTRENIELMRRLMRLENGERDA